MNRIKVSVIIPAYNAENTLGDCLNALISQSYPKNKYEIIVVDDGSKDNTVDVAKKFNVKIVKQKHRGPAIARNLGVKHAKGEIILFTDADCVPDKNWIRFMLKPFANEEIVGVSGTYKTLNKDKLIARFVGYEIDERHEAMKKQNNIDFIGTFSAGYRRKTFVESGGFDRGFTMASGEDPALSFKISKMGLKMIFYPKAFVYHKHPDTLLKLLKQKFWRGYWRMFLYKQHKDKIFRHSYTPKFLYAQIALLWLTLFSLSLGLFSLIPLSYVVVIFLLVFLSSIPIPFRIYRKDRIVGISAPFIITLQNFAISLGIIYGLAFLLKKK